MCLDSLHISYDLNTSVTPLYTLLAFLKIKFVHCARKKSKNTVESLTTITSRIRQLFMKPEMTAHERPYY